MRYLNLPIKRTKIPSFNRASKTLSLDDSLEPAECIARCRDASKDWRKRRGNEGNCDPKKESCSRAYPTIRKILANQNDDN